MSNEQHKRERQALEKTRARYQQATGCTRHQAEKRIAQILTERDNQNRGK
jgi:hypothetical protein